MEVTVPRLPSLLTAANHFDPMKIQRKLVEVLCGRWLTVQESFNQTPVSYIAGDEVVKVLKEVRAGECGDH